MELYEKILEAFPEISPSDCLPKLGIILQDDSDDLGAYIAQWNYSKPIPAGLSVGKPAS